MKLMHYHAPKLLAVTTSATELIAWVQSQPVLGFLGFVTSTLLGAYSWYQADQRKRHEAALRDGAMRLIYEANEAAIRDGRPAPYPEYLPPPIAPRRGRRKKAEAPKP